MATVKSMLNLHMHNSTWFSSQKHGFCAYSYILMLNESTEYLYVYFTIFKYYNMLFKNQSKMAAVKMAYNIFKTFENSS